MAEKKRKSSPDSGGKGKAEKYSETDNDMKEKGDKTARAEQAAAAYKAEQAASEETEDIAAGEWEQEKQDLTGRLLRLQADFDNYRKRMKMEKEMLEGYAIFAFVQKLLPILDNLERALSASSAAPEVKDPLTEGVALIFRQFTEILEKEGVLSMDCTGQPFDPNYHDAVLREENPDCAAGTVLAEIQKGYMFKERVLRASKVKVSG